MRGYIYTTTHSFRQNQTTFHKKRRKNKKYFTGIMWYYIILTIFAAENTELTPNIIYHERKNCLTERIYLRWTPSWI